MKQGTSLVKNSSQTVEIKDKTNEKKPSEQNICDHKLDGSDKKANTNTSPVEIKDKTNEKKCHI